MLDQWRAASEEAPVDEGTLASWVGASKIELRRILAAHAAKG